MYFIHAIISISLNVIEEYGYADFDTRGVSFLNRKINIAIVGVGFGAEFIPIYKAHPNAHLYAICARTEEKVIELCNQYGIENWYTDVYKLLKDPNIDAVHICTPIQYHAKHTIAALQAGKHVACAIPMATSIDDCKRIVEAQRKYGKNYMMMETTVYTREFLFVKELLDTKRLGRIQFLRGSHHQDMSGWPGYWEGLPPMFNATHAVSPLLALAGKNAEFVSCFGSGKILDHMISNYGSPFAVETALFRLKDSDLCAEVSRSLFETSRQYIESFDVYGDKMSFEWQRLEQDRPLVFVKEDGQKINVPDFAHLLPESIQKFTSKSFYEGGDEQHMSFIQGGGHGGSHPHLAHEFIMGIVENREPFPNAPISANWTCSGICAHESAMRNGEIVPIPQFL